MRNQHNHSAAAAMAAMTSRLIGLVAPLRTLAACSVASAAILATVTPASAGSYVYTQIQVGQSPFSCATGINSQNSIVGEYSGIGAAPFGGYVRFADGTVKTFQAPAADDLIDPCYFILGGAAINSKNLVVATYVNGVTSRSGPFTFNPTTNKEVRLKPPLRTSYPTAINASGVVIGTTDKYFDLQGHGFLTNNGITTLFDPPLSTSTTPTDIDDNGTIVGYANSSAGGTHGFIRTPNGSFNFVDVPGADRTQILSINDVGDVAGYYDDFSTGQEAGFTLTSAGFTKFSVPGSTKTKVLRVLSNGLVIGNYTTGNSINYGFTYLSGVFRGIVPAPGVQLEIESVNNQGNFVGNYSGALGPTAFVAVCPPGTGICRQ